MHNRSSNFSGLAPGAAPVPFSACIYRGVPCACRALFVSCIFTSPISASYQDTILGRLSVSRLVRCCRGRSDRQAWTSGSLEQPASLAQQESVVGNGVIFAMRDGSLLRSCHVFMVRATRCTGVAERSATAALGAEHPTKRPVMWDDSGRSRRAAGRPDATEPLRSLSLVLIM